MAHHQYQHARTSGVANVGQRPRVHHGASRPSGAGGQHLIRRCRILCASILTESQLTLAALLVFELLWHFVISFRSMQLSVNLLVIK